MGQQWFIFLSQFSRQASYLHDKSSLLARGSSNASYHSTDDIGLGLTIAGVHVGLNIILHAQSKAPITNVIVTGLAPLANDVPISRFVVGRQRLDGSLVDGGRRRRKRRLGIGGIGRGSRRWWRRWRKSCLSQGVGLFGIGGSRGSRSRRNGRQVGRKWRHLYQKCCCLWEDAATTAAVDITTARWIRLDWFVHFDK